VLEALGTFRTASALRKPPRGLGGHVVLLGLGKIGTRVLTRLRELNIPVVCVESDPEARGLATARRLRVPVVLGDVTQEGVLESAKIHRAYALLAVTSADTTNLEAVLYARNVRPDLRVVLRLYDDDFATAVYRTLRAAYPQALTRSRSVTHLAAPAFAGAMLGRQVLGAVAVERRVLLFAAVDVAGHPQLEGRTVRQAFRAGSWRVLALEGRTDTAPDHVLEKGDRVVVAATRRGLADLH
jgi:Trk K+ transport system NAD-binding subunit